ncbi:MAG: hypothetical protein ACYSUA_15640, partial [Planctomycetota bacterium]
MQHFLYFLPLPHGQGSLRPISLPALARDIPLLLLTDYGARRQSAACHSLGSPCAPCNMAAEKPAARPLPGPAIPGVDH